MDLPPASRWNFRGLGPYLLSLTLVALVGFAVAGDANGLMISIFASATLATVILYRLFPTNPHFSLSFANLVSVYASIFAFFANEVFGRIDPAILGFGFAVPMAAFTISCGLRRKEIADAVADPALRRETSPVASLVWLIPITMVGAIVSLLAGIDETVVDTNSAFISIMCVIGGIVLIVSRHVAVFLAEAGFLFDEFYDRMASVAIPAFAFLTCYSLLVVVFASVYTIMSQHTVASHFRVAGIARALNFPEAVYFSVVTLSTVGYGDIIPLSNAARAISSFEVVCGVMLLLFGVSELLEYTREHRHAARRRKHHTEMSDQS